MELMDAHLIVKEHVRLGARMDVRRVVICPAVIVKMDVVILVEDLAD